MRQSRLFVRTRKDPPKDEVSVNAQLLSRAGFIDKLMAGVYSYLPLGMRVLKKIEAAIRTEMDGLGEEILMPGLQPKGNWEQTGRWAAYDSLFRFTSFYTKGEYVLGPTHEEVVVPLVQKFNLSYKDLPVSVYQIQTKFRDEARAKSGILRGREFLMKDLYSFHATENDLDAYYEKAIASYRRIFSAVGISHVTYLTFASGGTFSKYSHEFQTLTPSGEDIIHICDACELAINREIIAEQAVCPSCSGTRLREEKAVEVGNVFKLKTKYSSAFGLKFKDKDGSDKDVIMGCYGIGLTRLMGTIVEVHHDDKGIVWPAAVAPFQAHILEIGRDGAVGKAAQKLYDELQTKGVEVLYDDRSDASPGEKLAEADLIGIPNRIVVSAKTLEKERVELKKRNETITALVDSKNIARELG